MKKNNPTTVRLSPEDERKLDELVRTTGRTKSFYIKQLFSLYLDRLITMYSLDQVIKDAKAGTSKRLSSDEVEAMFTSDDE